MTVDAGAASVLRRAAAHVVVDDVDAAALDEPAAHHVFRVLRVADGEVVTVTDGRGRWRACRARTGTAAIEPDGPVQAAPPRSRTLTVAVAIPKGDRPEWIVQKLTELGIDRVVLLHADRGVVRWDPARAGRHLARLRRVAVEALQQSRGVWLPVVEGPTTARDLLVSAVAAEPGGRPIDDRDVSVAIGPEGGWTASELAAAHDTVSLSSGILRVETAAVAAAVAMCRVDR